MLLSLRGILLCRIRPLQPSGGSEQVFLPGCHLGTLPSPITTLGFCAEKGRSVMAGLGKACGRCTGEQGGLDETRGLSTAVAELGSWAARVCRQQLVGHVLRNRDLWSPLWAGSHWGEQQSWVWNWPSWTPATTSHPPVSRRFGCVGKGQRGLHLGEEQHGSFWGLQFRQCRHTGKGLQTSW